jgi:hypothetical protein
MTISFSRPSPAIFSINVPEVNSISVNFTYNYYTFDEGTNEISGVPEVLMKSSPEQSLSMAANYSNKLPRYVTIKWSRRNIEQKEKFPFSSYVNKISSEESFISSRYISYTFSSSDIFENAFSDINDNGNLDFGTSQATAIDNFVQTMMSNYKDTNDQSERLLKRNKIAEAVKNIERIADRPSETLGFRFLDQKGNESFNTSGFDELVKKSEGFLTAQVNATVTPDIFLSSSLSENTLNEINRSYVSSINRISFDVNDAVVKPISFGEFTDPIQILPTKKTVIGYLIERYEATTSGLVKDKIIPVQNPDAISATDAFVKYGAVYYYSIRTVAKIETVGYDEEEQTTRMMTYLVASRPKMASVECFENVPPPPPTDINFVWDYKKSKLKIVWSLPFNPQRDIKQFQVFRRKSIHEPFELIGQKSFDFSTKKFVSGELVDANRQAMTAEEASYVESASLPIMYHIDNDFETDIDMLKSSKYIYTVASVDAHGLISNYGSQFEVTFDFFKNKIQKSLISGAGAPRQYPNLKLNIDLFKDVIKTEGQSSKRMKIYFMPEYFSIRYGDYRVQNIVSTSRDNAYYKLQFINTQNQKSDSLKIVINDPDELTKNDVLL